MHVQVRRPLVVLRGRGALRQVRRLLQPRTPVGRLRLRGQTAMRTGSQLGGLLTVRRACACKLSVVTEQPGGHAHVKKRTLALQHSYS